MALIDGPNHHHAPGVQVETEVARQPRGKYGPLGGVNAWGTPVLAREPEYHVSRENTVLHCESCETADVGGLVVVHETAIPVQHPAGGDERERARLSLVCDSSGHRGFVLGCGGGGYRDGVREGSRSPAKVCRVRQVGAQLP